MSYVRLHQCQYHNKPSNLSIRPFAVLQGDPNYMSGADSGFSEGGGGGGGGGGTP